MSIIDDNTVSNNSANESLESVAKARVSRRGAIVGGLAAVGGVSALLSSVPAIANGPLLGFTGVAPSSLDEVVVPPGYTASVLIAWGDPVSTGPAFNQDASNTAAEQAQQWGMHNDGLVYFPIKGSRHGLIVQNHEYTDDVLLFPDGVAGWNQEKTNKSLNGHGVGIIEVKQADGDADCGFGLPGSSAAWEVVRPSRFARRITGQTPIAIGGPAAGDPRLVTSADPSGRLVLGTLNNCAMGFTPWGTYLACEENFNGYFRKTGPQTELERRYGITAAGFGYLWHTTDTRFSVDAEPNELNRFGWVVEIDPFKPDSTPVKRTALGRIKHEGAWVQEARDGRVVVYMGDDEQFEYIYRYVSNLPWRKARKKNIDPLDDGILYVAKFNADGTGQWLPLTPSNPALASWSLNDILINTRGAADLAGATKLDRPEWIDTFPDAGWTSKSLAPHGTRTPASPAAYTCLPDSPESSEARS